MSCIVLYLLGKDGDSALIRACFHNQVNVVKILLKVPGIDINLHSVNKKTALDYAVNMGHEDLANLLRAHGAISSNETSDLNTPTCASR